MSQKNNRQQRIEWRRNKVQELLIKGYNHYEIADTLKIPRTTVSRDVGYLRQKAQEQLKTHIQDRLPEEYQNCMAGINRVLKLTLEVADKPTDDKTRLQALALANDCYKYKIDLTTNGVVVTDAIKYVQAQLDHVNKTEKSLLQDIKEDNEKENTDMQKTRNGVF